jgi:hypothetical protein
MAKADSIPAFPADLDRDAFGHWLSGFTDGEATFNLYAVSNASDGRRESLRACFRIALRADDLPVINLIRSYWGCGTLIYLHNTRIKTPNAKPVYNLNVSKLADIVNVVVPHYDRFPLRSKKRNDFEIFKQGVAMLRDAAERPHPCRGVGWHAQKGTTKWLDSERDDFKRLVGQLNSSRVYSPPRTAPSEE